MLFTIGYVPPRCRGESRNKMYRESSMSWIYLQKKTKKE